MSPTIDRSPIVGSGALNDDNYSGLKKLLEWTESIKETGLHKAVADRQIKVTKLLLAHGADVNYINKDGLSPLMIAAQINSSTMMKILLEHGADSEQMNSKKMRPLHIVIGEEDRHCNVNIKKDCIKCLLEYGVDIEAKNGDGETPLIYAVKKNQPQIVELLLAAGSDPEVEDESGRSVLLPLIGAHVELGNPDNFIIRASDLPHWHNMYLQVGPLILKRLVVGLGYKKREFETFCNFFNMLVNLDYNNLNYRYKDKFQVEVDLMKNHIIYDSMSLHDIFIAQNPRVNEELVKGLMRINNWEEYPLYKDMISSKITSIITSYQMIPVFINYFNLLMSLQHISNKLPKQTLPRELILNIMSNFNYMEVKKFINTCKVLERKYLSSSKPV